MQLAEGSIERYFRPKAVAQATLTSAWGDSEYVWVADAAEGYVLAKPLKEEDGRRAELEDTGAIIETAGKAVVKSNPSRNDRTEDMAHMTELNEATVLHNLKRRYLSSLLYVPRRTPI